MTQQTVTVGQKMTLKNGNDFVPLEIFGKTVFGREKVDGCWQANSFFLADPQLAGTIPVPASVVLPKIPGVHSTGHGDNYGGYAGGL